MPQKCWTGGYRKRIDLATECTEKHGIQLVIFPCFPSIPWLTALLPRGIILVGLLFYKARAQRQVHFFLDRRTFIVGYVHCAGQFDKALAEVLIGFLVPDIVLDHPELLVDRLELL